MKKSQLMGCIEGTERLISQEDTLRESLQVNGFQKLTYLQQQPAFAEDNLGESSQSCIMEEQMQENQEQTGPNQFTPVNRDNDTTGHSQPDETTLNAEEKTEITANELKSELDTHCEETVTSNDISSIKCDDTLAKIKFHLHDTTPKHSDTESEYCDCKSMVSVDSNPGAVIRDRTDVKSDISLEDEDKSSISSSESLKTSSCSSICTFARSTQSTLVDFCRICHCEGDAEVGPLIAPCNCRGSLRYVHQNCLQQWIKSSDSKHCELCGYHFVMDSEMKPFLKWKKLSMSTNERRKIMCSVMFHIIAITCVIWSLYVLIEKTTEEISNGNLQWPFWTKLVVVAIGFTGGLIFMYVQCKVYVQLWKRLKAFNRVIYVKNNSIKDGSTEDHSTIDAGSVGSNIEPQKNHSSVTGISQSTSGRDGVVVIEMSNQDN